jgi:hypothetical protein
VEVLVVYGQGGAAGAAVCMRADCQWCCLVFDIPRFDELCPPGTLIRTLTKLMMVRGCWPFPSKSPLL